MTQADVMKILEKERKWMTSKEIAKVLNVSPKNVMMNLRRLFNHEAVQRKDIPKFKNIGAAYSWMVA